MQTTNIPGRGATVFDTLDRLAIQSPLFVKLQIIKCARHFIEIRGYKLLDSYVIYNLPLQSIFKCTSSATS